MTSAGIKVANVVDFAAYRARRNRAAAADQVAAPGGMMFAVLPMMISVVAWIPIWQLPPTTRPRDTINE